jgi:Trypsin-co-occurring domain 2
MLEDAHDPVDNAILTLVSSLKSAIRAAEQPLLDNGLIITRAQVRLNLTLSRTDSAGLKLKLSVFELEGGVGENRDDTITLTLSLVPSKTRLESGIQFDQDVRMAVAVIGMAARQAAMGRPAFDLEEATAELAFTEGSDGKAVFGAVFGGSTGSARAMTHTLILTFAPK